jgi:ParB-like chromosome segregation protein Spo0J
MKVTGGNGIYSNHSMNPPKTSGKRRALIEKQSENWRMEKRPDQAKQPGQKNFARSPRVKTK